MSNQTYEIATKLANDLAEEYVGINIADMMIEDSKAKAKRIRALSEENVNTLHPAIQEYRESQRAIYGAIYNLIEGYHGYKICEIV